VEVRLAGRRRRSQGLWKSPFSGTSSATTLRFFDATIDARRSTWIEPVNGRVRKFIGREDDSEILLVSLDDDPPLRWRFTEISIPHARLPTHPHKVIDIFDPIRLDYGYAQMLGRNDVWDCTRSRPLIDRSLFGGGGWQGSGGW
jgi:hypothetical protein